MPTRVVSFSELDALRQCPLKHHLAYEERWKTADVSPALSRGKAFHTCMEAYYRAEGKGNRLDAAMRALMDCGVDEEQHELLHWMLTGYAELYGADSNWRIVDVERAIEFPLYNRAGNPTRYRMKGRVDLLVEDMKMGGLWIVDHKTCRNLPKEKDYDFDDQSGIYTLGLKRLGLDVRGAIFNACRTQKLVRAMSMEERFKRVPTVRAEQELRTMEIEVHEEFQNRFRADPQVGVLPPRRPDPDRCGWRCSFTEACLASRKGGDIREYLSAIGGSIDPTRH